MGMCRIDLYEEDRRFLQEYDMSTPKGVERFFLDYHRVCAAAARSNLAAVDALVDVAVAMDDAGLSLRERDCAQLVYFDGWDVDETAGILDVDVGTVMALLSGTCEKVANYLGGTEGYERVS